MFQGLGPSGRKSCDANWEYVTGFRTGSGQTGFSQKGHKSPMLPYFASSAHALPHFATSFFCLRFAMQVDYGELRHFCDDPVCPDPVWKLSMYTLPSLPHNVGMFSISIIGLRALGSY